MRASLIKTLMIGVLALAGGAIGWLATGGDANPAAGAAAPSSVPILVNTSALPRDARVTTSYAPIVRLAAPSVVNVFSTKVIRNPNPELRPFFNDPFLRRFFGFGENMPRAHKERSLGSGVVITKDGYILTNNHVVEGADEVQVSLATDKKEYPAKVIGRDALTDLAVLKITAPNLPAITFGDSDRVEVGDVVLAMGNPFGVGQTVTMGIISAVKRSGFGIEGYEDFLQTDAAINPGNSGGALVDAEGRLIGINTAILSRSGGYQGVGFAVPANLARNIMEQLIKAGKVVRGYLGVSIQDLTPELAQQFKLPPNTTGALVGEVTPDSPAAKAGLKSGDVITAINGQLVKDSQSLQMLISNMRPGTKVQITVLRDGKQQTFTPTLGELPQPKAEAATSAAPSAPENQGRALAGVAVADLNSKLRQELNIPDYVKGAVIANIDPNSAAYDAGLRAGDVIEEIDRKPVTSAKAAVQASRNVKGKQALVRVWSQGGSRYVVVNAGSPE